VVVAAAAVVGAVAAETLVARRVRDAPFVLVPRTPTLGGSVPLRAARSCPPFLLANGFGWYLRPRSPITLKRGLRGVTAEGADVSTRVRSGATIEVTVDTGISLAPPDSVRCVLERPRNLRDRRVECVRAPVAPGESIRLRLLVSLRRGEQIVLEGVLAAVTLWVLPPEIRIVPSEDGSELVRAHVAFFDDAYFSKKRGAPTEKYKRLERGVPEATKTAPDSVTVVHLGGAPPRVTLDEAGIPALVLSAELDTEFAFHGRVVEPTVDRAALRRREPAIRAAMRAALGEEAPEAAVRYFSTYITTHAPGDPHAFFKPATLVATEPGWALVVDGPDGDGLEGLRGITDPSWFHALPAVAEIVGARGRVKRGQTLVTARLTRRDWLRASLVWE